jgi:mersacidin/lichenicidin family type 2 lantibiotic
VKTESLELLEKNNYIRMAGCSSVQSWQLSLSGGYVMIGKDDIETNLRVSGTEITEGKEGSAEKSLTENAWRNSYEFLKLTEQERAALGKNPAGLSPLELEDSGSGKFKVADNNTLAPCSTGTYCTGPYCTGPYCTGPYCTGPYC